MVPQCRKNAQIGVAPNLRFFLIDLVVAAISSVPGHVAIQQERIRLFAQDALDERPPRCWVGCSYVRGIGEAHVAVRHPREWRMQVLLIDGECWPGRIPCSGRGSALWPAYLALYLPVDRCRAR